MERIRVHTSELMERAKTLRAGDQLLLSGTIYTARDAAHKRICAQLDRGEEPPFPIQGRYCKEEGLRGLRGPDQGV